MSSRTLGYCAAAVLCLTLFCSTRAASAAASLELSIEAAMTRARRDSTAIAIRLAEAQAERAAISEAEHAYLPTLALSAGAGAEYVHRIAPEPSASYASRGYDAGLIGRVRLLDFGGRSQAVEAARRRSNATRADIESLRLEAARAAGEAFLAVQMDGELLGKLEEVLRYRRQMHQAIEALVEARIRPSVDLRRSEAELARTSLLIRVQEIEERADRAALALLLGLPPSTPIALRPVSLEQLGEPAPLAANTLTLPQSDPQVAAAEERTAQARAIERQAESALWPTLDASFGAGLVGTASLHGEPPLIPDTLGRLDVRLQLSWQALDVTAWDRREQARKLTRAARAAADDTRLRRQHAVYAAGLDVELAKGRLDQAEQVAAMFLVTLDMSWERYRLGQASLVDVLTVQGEWQDAELARCRERFSYGAAKIALALLTGRG